MPLESPVVNFIELHELYSVSLSFYMQGQELTVRQMALLGFRDLVLMQLSLGDLLQKNLSLIPASITQMLLVLQVNVNHEPMINLFKHLYCSWLFLCM